MTSLSRRDWLRSTTATMTGVVLLPASAMNAVNAAENHEYTLPKLPYAYDALAPHIDAKTMEIHHSKHHAAYIANLNKALAGTDWLGKPIEEVLRNLGKLPEEKRLAVRNNGGGHFNHTLFWQVMSPKKSKPSKELSEALDNSFKGWEGFEKTFAAAAMGRFGSGWAWLTVDKVGKLAISSTANQDNPLMMKNTGTPILALDVWEHAYYLNYQNRRADYVSAFMNVINWDFVSALYQKARQS